MIIARDRRVGRWFWKVETSRHRWSLRVHFWLNSWNWLRLNRQRDFTDLRIARCVVLGHHRLGRSNVGASR